MTLSATRYPHLAKGKRVLVPAYTWAYVAGDKYGVVTKVGEFSCGAHLWHVRLEKSGKTVRVAADDCADASQAKA